MFEKRLGELIDVLVKDKKTAKVNGYPVFNENALFLPGSIFEGAAYSISLKYERNKVNETGISDTKSLIEMIMNEETNTFGILGQLSGLYRLKKSGIYNRVIDKKTEKVLKNNLHWEKFVDIDGYILKGDLPFNYYSVAFRCAKLREALGWDTEVKSNKLLDIFLKHSKKNNYMDETMGEGRYDRYSLLTPAELAEIYVVVGEEVPARIKEMLLLCAKRYLKLANEEGYGISFGRSLGVFGDSAVTEVLSIAARIGILTKEEKALAKRYCDRVEKRIKEFWYDDELESINIWLKGRRSDGYRDIGRVFGTNITVLLRYIKAAQYWKEVGEVDTQNVRFFNAFDSEIIYFSKEKYERCLVVVRDGKHRFQLPVVNGSHKYYNTTPYYSIPYENRFIEGIADETTALYTPIIRFEDGRKAMPLVFSEKVEHHFDRSKNEVTVNIYYENLCFIENEIPEKLEGTRAKVEYIFKKGEIQRRDIIFFDDCEVPESIQVDILSFDEGEEIQIEGLEERRELEVKGRKYDTPTGSYIKGSSFESRKVKGKKTEVLWKIRY